MQNINGTTIALVKLREDSINTALNLFLQTPTMNVAIPLFGTRVSPRFDCAQAVLLIEAVDGQCRKRQEIAFSELAPHERINRLLGSGIDTVICGGIDRWSAESLQSAGVKIFAFVTGEAEDAMSNLLAGSLIGGDPNIGIPSDQAGCFVSGRRGRRMDRESGGGQGLGGGQGGRGKCNRPGGGRGRRRGPQ